MEFEYHRLRTESFGLDGYDAAVAGANRYWLATYGAGVGTTRQRARLPDLSDVKFLGHWDAHFEEGPER